MSSYLKISLFLIILVFSTFSCKVTEKSLSDRAETKANIANIDHEIFNNKLSYRGLILKNAKIEINTDDQKIKLRANLKIKNDSAIFISLSNNLGIEVTRVLFTKDSIQFIDRINRNFIQGDYAVIAGMYQIPFDYENLEQVLVNIHAQYFLTDHKMSKRMQSHLGYYNIEKEGKYFSAQYKINNQQHLISEVLYQLNNYPANVLVRYSNYAKFEQGFFPEKIEVQIQQGDKTVMVDINFNQVNAENIGNIFINAPKSYQRIYP